MSEVTVTKANFEEEVLKSDKTVLVDFWASWCGPCRALGPVIAEIAEEYPEIKVCKINVDDEGELAEAYNIISIPTMIKFKDGAIAGKMVGMQPKKQIVDMILE